MQTPRLITIPISHYCEKARWALEKARIPYADERHLQGFHLWPAYRAGRGDTVPVLVTSEGTFTDSTDILKWVDSKASPGINLYPIEVKQEVEQFEDDLDEGFGVAGRLWMYTHMLKQIPTLLKYSKMHGVPWHERILLPLIFPLLEGLVNRSLELTPTSREDSINIVDSVFEKIAQKTSGGQRYLFGNGFTAADLTFAALAASVLVPEDYGVPLPPLSELPAEMRDKVISLREHPAGKFALRLYAKHRKLN